MKRPVFTLLSSLTLLSSIVLSACGDDEKGADEAKGGAAGAPSGAEGGASDGAGGGEGEPAPESAGILIHTTAFGPNFAATTLLHVVPTLTPDLELDAAAAVEVSGRADVSVPPPGLGLRSFFVGLSEEPTIRQYDIDDDGNVAEGPEVSLQGLGATSAASLISGLTFVSNNRAYFVDVATRQVIVIDPENMEILSDFPLPDLELAEAKTMYSWYKNVDGDRLIVAFAYDRQDDTPSPTSKVAIINMADDTVIYDEQSDCGYLSWTSKDADGNMYFASHTYVAILGAAGLAGDPSFSPCMVRILAGADGFDPDYYVDLGELAGAPVGSLMSGGDGTGYTLVYESDTAITADNVNDAYSTPGWKHYSMELGDEAATFAPVPAIAGGIPYSGWASLVVDGARLPVVTEVAEGFSETKVYDASDPSDWALLATIPNYIYGIHNLP